MLYCRAAATPAATATIAIAASGAVEPWTYARLARATRNLAAALVRAGVRKGDRILIVMDRTPQWQVAMCACLHVGAIPVPCVTQASATEIAYRVERCAPVGAITEAGYASRFPSMQLLLARGAGLESILAQDAEPPPPARMAADDAALMYFTSGSSGPPKAVTHAARGVYVRSRQPWKQLGMGPGDIIWTTSDTGWTRAGSCLVFGAWMNGAVAMLHEAPPEPAQRVGLLEQFGVTLYGAVTTELRLILAGARKRPLPRLRWTLSAGEAMTAEMAERWSEFSGRPLLVGYGQSETPTATLTDPATPAVNGMIGKPMEGNDVRIVDAVGTECPDGVQGDLVFAATDPGLMLGYWINGKPSLPLRAGKWHVTGDCGYRDPAGNLYFVGRDDDIISSAGYRIGPTEVENALTLHPAVAECAVVASPDAVRGEVVKAFVVLRNGQAGGAPLAAELQEHVKRQIAPYKYPRKLEFVDDLPRTASGKISRRLLRNAEFQQGGTS